MPSFEGIDTVKPSFDYHFDWMTFVVVVDDYDQLSNFTNACGIDLFDKWIDLKNGIYSYPVAKATASGTIITGLLEKPGYIELMVQMSGQGLATFVDALANDSRSLDQVIDVVYNWDGHFSRIDAALDLYNYPKEYSPMFVGYEARKGHVVSRATRGRIVDEFPLSIGGSDENYASEYEGFTFYIGRNPKQLRVYNKLAERYNKVAQMYQLKAWFRWEYQMNGDVAQLFMDSYVQRNHDLEQTWVDYLASNYRWIEEVGHQEKRSRYPNAVWYDKMISKSQLGIKLNKRHEKPTLKRSEKWLSTQVKPRLATMYESRRRKYVQNGISDYDAKHLAIVRLQIDLDELVAEGKIDETMIESWLLEHENDPTY